MLIWGSWGCVKSSTNTPASAIAYVELINEAPYASAADMYLNGTLVSSGLAPGTYSEEYGQVKPGTYDVQFKVAGGDSVLAEIPTAVFDTSNFYTLIMYNKAPHSAAVQAVEILDNYTSIAPANAYYRFFNLSPDLPKVDLLINAQVAQLARTPADNVGNLAYDAFTDIDPANYSLSVNVSGTDTVLASTSSYPLAAGGVYTIFIGGERDSTETNKLVLEVLPAAF